MIQVHAITNTSDYNQQRFDFLVGVEGKEPAVHSSAGDPTIGVGFNLKVESVRKAVFSAFGIRLDRDGLSDEAKEREAYYQDKLTTLLTGSYTTDLRSKLDAIMLERSQDARLKDISEISNRTAFAFSGEGDPKMREVLDAVAYIYERKVTQRLATKGVQMTNSEERLALFSLAYNTREGKTNLLGPKLIAAIATGDRAEAWYQICCESNLHRDQARRRFDEAYQLGLWYDPNNITTAETEAFAKMVGRNADAMARYFGKYGVVDPNDRKLTDLERAISDFGLDPGLCTLKGIFSRLGIDLDNLISTKGSLKNALGWFANNVAAGNLKCQTGRLGFVDRFLNLFHTAEATIPKDPLILDLNGDGEIQGIYEGLYHVMSGSETTGINEGAYFDYDGDGFAEQTGWASPDDGLLVRDLRAHDCRRQTIRD